MTGTITNGSNVITNLSAIYDDISIGSAVIGQNIPTGTVVTGISATNFTITISNVATGTAIDETISFGVSNPSLDPGFQYHPYGIAIDSSQNMYITNSRNSNGINVDGDNTIYKIPINYTLNSTKQITSESISSLALRNLDQNNAIYTSEYSKDTGLPYDPFLYGSANYPFYYGRVMDTSNNTIFYDSSNNKPILRNPTSMVYDSCGNLYVANVKSNNIIKITPSSVGSTFLDNSGVSISQTGYMNNPCSVAFNLSFTYMYVCDYFGNNIIQVSFPNPATSRKTMTLIDASGNSAALFRPTAIIFDPLGNLYVCNSGSNNIIKISNIDVSGATGTASVYSDPISGKILNEPFSIAFDSGRNLYVSNNNDKTMAMVTNDGYVSYFKYETLFNSAGVPITNASVILFDSSDNMYLTNLYEYYTKSFDTSSNATTPYTPINFVYKLKPTYLAYIVYDSAVDSFQNAYYLTLDSSGSVYVASSECIYKYTNNDIIQWVTDPLVRNQFAIAFDVSQNMYTIDSSGSQIYVILQPSLTVTPFTLSGVSLNSAKDLIFDKFNNLYIANYGSNKIIKVPLTVGATSGTGTNITFTGPVTSIKFPYRLALDSSNNMYIGHDHLVPGYQFPFIVKVNLSTFYAEQYVTIPYFPDPSGADVDFTITGVTVDKKGYLYVVQSNYNQTYTVLYKSNSPTTSATNSLFQLALISPNNNVSSLKYDKFENCLLVSQQGTNDIDKYFLSFTFDVANAGLRPLDNDLTIHLAYSPDYYSNTVLPTTMTSGNSNLVVSPSTSTIPLGSLVTGSGIQYSTTDASGGTTVTFLDSYPNTVSISVPPTATQTVDVSYSSLITKFIVYPTYIVVDPSTVPVNIPASLQVYFVDFSNNTNYPNPTLPDPVSKYVAINSSGNAVSSSMVNNKIVISPLQFPGSAFPTGLAYSDSNVSGLPPEFYVPLSNNSVSIFTSLDEINYTIVNNYIHDDAGLLGPTNTVVDNSGNVYILNSKGTTISEIQYAKGRPILNNNFFTGIVGPLYLAIDNSSVDSSGNTVCTLYLLSGESPNYIITQISTENPSINTVMKLPLGLLNNPLALCVDMYVLGYNYLYITDTNPLGTNVVYRVALNKPASQEIYTVDTLTTMVNVGTYITTKNDGFLYVVSKKAGTISKFAVDPYYTSVDPWMNSCIYNPTGIVFDVAGVLFVASGGTNPNNNKITQIYTDSFKFDNLTLSSSSVLRVLNQTTNNVVPNSSFTVNTI